jgi:Tfp pilus assembly protein PilX
MPALQTNSGAGRPQERGMALLMTLTVMVLLMTAGLHINRQVRKSLETAATQRDQLIIN